jgi:hypothetical protein
VSSGLATLAELDSVYSLEDMWDLLEIHSVNRHNQAIVDKEPPQP